MKIKAAVVREAGKPISIEELDLAAPKENEVLVKFKYTGWCRSDYHLVKGEIPIAMPFVVGHEAAGVVEEVGSAVTHLKPGDSVVTTWMIPCGKCKTCLEGRGYLCQGHFGPFLEGKLLDGTSRLKDKGGAEVLHGNFVSGFATHSVVPAMGAIKVKDGIPLDQACFLGCCVPTGWGSVYNVAKVKPGESVAVWGMGGVGLNIIRAAKMRLANPIIAVDLEASKEDVARKFGATHFIDNSKEDPIPKIIEQIAPGGVDYAFEAIGDPGAIIQAWWATAMGAKLVIPGITAFDATTNLQLMLLPLHEKQIIGTLYGNVSTVIDIPRLMDLMLEGGLQTQHLIGSRFKVEQINDVVEAMANRKIIGRAVCEWD
jgi:S-(hydroxymethyl)glutathione dehydrogenase/alcohol dehydrogenase